MKPTMLVAALLVTSLTTFSTAQQKPKFIKVQLEDGVGVDHNTSISADSKYVYLPGLSEDATDANSKTTRTCPINAWNLETGKKERTVLLPVCGESFSVSPDQKTIVIASSYGKSPIYAIDLQTLKILWQFDYNPYNPRYSPSGRFIVMGSYGGPLFIYNALGIKLARLDANEQGEAPCCSHAFSQDESLLVLRASNKLEVYETKNFTRLIRIPLESGQTRTVQLTKDNKFILSYDPISKYPALWDRVTGKIVKIYKSAAKCTKECDLYIESDNKTFVNSNVYWESSYSQKQVKRELKLIDFKSGNSLRSFPNFAIRPLFTPDNKKLVYGSYGSVMYIWNFN